MLFIDTSSLIEWGGVIIIIAFIFAETGFLLGLVVPGGETLLFTSGLLVSTGKLQVDILVLLVSIMSAAILGDISGFYIGRKFKDRLYKKEDTWYFRKKFLTMAENYIQKHQTRALIIGKYIPVIRPFTPVITGTTKLPFSSFLPVSAAAVITYVSTFTLAGYFLGSKFPEIKDYLVYILPVGILVALMPVIIQVYKNKRSSS